MLSKPTPLWILAGGFVLAGCAGIVNAVGFLGLHYQAMSHMSGTVTMLGVGIGGTHTTTMLHSAGVLAFFFLGASLSGLITGGSTLRLGPRYGAALTGVSLLLVGATWFLRHNSFTGYTLAAMACGLQNAMASSYSGAVVRTTHVTGIVTDLGIAVGLAARRERVDWRRMRLYMILLTGFFFGGISGTIGFNHIGYMTLLIPAAITGTAGVIYTFLRQEHLQK